MKESLLLVLALSAHASARSALPTSGLSTAQESGDRTAQVVTEIDARIWCIYQGRNGDLWFGSNGNGVYRYDGQRVTRYARADGLSGHQVRDIEEDSEGNILVSTTEGVTRFDGRTWTELTVEAAPPGGGWVLDPEDVWIVVDPGSGGPCRYDGKTLSWMFEERLTTTPGGGAFGIRSIYEDRAGDFWICNTRQRFRFSAEASLVDGYRLVGYEKRDGLPDARSDDGRNFTYFPSLTEDEAGNLWMACGSDGVWKYDGEAVTHYRVGEGAYALQVYSDREGRMWVGTLEHGIFTFDGELFAPFDPHERSK